MSDGRLRGKVHLIEPTKTYGQKGFRKRLVVLEQPSDRFTNYVPFEFVQDGCDTVDEMKIGDEVEIAYRLTGRKWQKDPGSETKYFLSAEALRFQLVGDAGDAPSARGRKSGGNPNDAFDEAGQDDDVPF